MNPPLTLLLTALGAAALAACSTSNDSIADAPAGTLPALEHGLPIGGVERLDGDVALRAELVRAANEDGSDLWRFGDCSISTALPAGYPAPTPPGAIELKRYPTVRRAEVGGDVNPDMGMTLAFWPLFQHIKQHEIAMTSPVEFDFGESAVDDQLGTGGWTMSFLYRQPDMGTPGVDGKVAVVDRADLTVVSIGVRGNYGWSTSNAAHSKLKAWIDSDGRFEVTGAPRALYYNGPDKRPADKWAEVQIPVRARIAAGS